MQTSQSSPRAGKYLTFALAAEGYGVPIGRVRSIIGYVPVTPVPRTAAHVRGVINLRGQVIPVIDLRERLRMPTVPPAAETCIIVVETRQGGRVVMTGVIVDKVCEVPQVPEEAIEDAPPLGAGVDTRFILGLAKIGNAVKILLDLDYVIDGAAAAEAA